MAYDGLVIRALARELNTALAGGKIEKIYQPQREELVLYVRSQGTRYKLYLSCDSSHPGAYLTQENFDNPPQPSAFCMLLRKHLQSSVLLQIRQKDWERILEVQVETFDELGIRGTKRLIIEIMGKHSNIVFVDDDKGRVLDAIKRISLDVSRPRQLLPGFPYDYPPTGGKMSPDAVRAQDIEGWTADHRDIADGLVDHIQGLSPLLARELPLDTSEKDPPSETSERIASRLQDMLQQVEKPIHPMVYLKEDGTPVDFHILPIRSYADRYGGKTFPTLSQAIEWYYTNRDASNRLRQKSADVTRAVQSALKKARRKQQRLEEDLQAAQQGDTYRLYGELLTANLHACRTGDRQVTVTNYYDGNQVTIPLDVRYAPSKNAQLYYKKYSKSKTAIREKTIQIEENTKDIAYLESVADLVERATDTGQLEALKEELIETGFLRRKVRPGTKSRNKPAPFHYRSHCGLDILAGRNNKENDELTFRVAGKNDIWLHTKDIPGSHVILFVKGKEPDDRSLYEAARIAAFHSKAQRSENVPVDYTLVRYVKKPHGAKPGMAIFTDQRTLYVDPKLPER